MDLIHVPKVFWMNCLYEGQYFSDKYQLIVAEHREEISCHFLAGEQRAGIIMVFKPKNDAGSWKKSAE